MNTDANIPPENKLILLYRLEPGCLGPKGNEHIEKFCRFAQENLAVMESEVLQYEIVPRYDKSLAEIQYMVNGRQLANDKAAKYLSTFARNIEEVEDQINHALVDLIEQYMIHK